ncbi:MAG: hypothetical protein U0992_21770 [Planctomycetaceae bacterium]
MLIAVGLLVRPAGRIGSDRLIAGSTHHLRPVFQPPTPAARNPAAGVSVLSPWESPEIAPAVVACTETPVRWHFLPANFAANAFHPADEYGRTKRFSEKENVLQPRLKDAVDAWCSTHRPGLFRLNWSGSGDGSDGNQQCVALVQYARSVGCDPNDEVLANALRELQAANHIEDAIPHILQDNSDALSMRTMRPAATVRAGRQPDGQADRNGLGGRRISTKAGNNVGREAAAASAKRLRLILTHGPSQNRYRSGQAICMTVRHPAPAYWRSQHVTRNSAVTIT